MLKQYHHTTGVLFRVADALVISFAWIVSYWLRFYVPLIEVTKGFPEFKTYAALTPLIVILWWITFSQHRLYKSQRLLRRTHEAFLILRAHGIALLYFITLTYLFSEYKYSRGVLLYFGIIGTVLLIFFRLAIRNTLRVLRKRGYNLRHAVAIGTGPVLEDVVDKLRRFPELGIQVQGVITPDSTHPDVIQETPVIGHFSSLAELLKVKRPDLILIALPRKYGAELEAILATLKDETMDIQLVPDIHEFTALGCTIEDFDGLPLVRLNDSPLEGPGAILKRLTDFVAALTGLLLISPILIVVAILVKLTSRGPIFYSQERMGLDGRTFPMYKFRSMRVDAEKESGAVWAIKNDQRRTPIGTFLRSTSLDELPQLWNVVRGDMSLVGPRPERPVFVTQFRGEIPHYMLRHKVKSGITGWAQVNGWRGDTSLERRIECDLYYIRNWSYTLDLK
ncbi:MAG: undecaprenyl-phosphate glucose phosphotransferase, partial [Proteobacteria bacterium]